MQDARESLGGLDDARSGHDELVADQQVNLFAAYRRNRRQSVPDPQLGVDLLPAR